MQGKAPLSLFEEKNIDIEGKFAHMHTKKCFTRTQKMIIYNNLRKKVVLYSNSKKKVEASLGQGQLQTAESI